MLKFINKIFGTMNDREVKKLNKIVEEVNSLEGEIQALSDSQLVDKTGQFRQRLEAGETLEDLLPEAFAVVREASSRVLGMRPFDVQVLGGIVLHQGRIAEMKTGEGKTLVATLPAYLNALTGRGVHIVTVNDYLATRDSQWMGRVYQFLGLKVGLVVHGLEPAQRKESYQADIIYGTNNEFGFDYLRDNMVVHLDNRVQRELNFAIVDEVDSILIDEARTPLIISGQAEQATGQYQRFAAFVPTLKVERDYTVDEKAHLVVLTEEGDARVEDFLGMGKEELYDPSNIALLNYLNQALKAQALMKKDRDYVVKDGEVIIVDEFTGRLMYGRRYSNGLHQAIEAKERVKVAKESMTLATITFQNYFRMYNKLAGMTGTAATEEEEFQKIYGLDVVVVPTNQPMVREDLPDLVYKTEEGKFRALVQEIDEKYRQGQPCLVGTISIEKSELLSGWLKKRGIPHQVLNARYHDREAYIISQAGRPGMVTISTNMAGRGTDIMLGGNPGFMAEEDFRARYGYPIHHLREGKEEGLDPGDKESQEKEFSESLGVYREKAAREKEEVKKLGGLHIIGTERHESRRIDNQLRGRSGRQGDQGSSRFYISLEDDLMRLFGSDNVRGIMDKVGMEEDQPIDHPVISKAIESAQKKVESRNFDIRRHVLEYDEVMNEQRRVIYQQRQKVLEGQDLKGTLQEMIGDIVEEAVDLYASEKVYPEDWDLKSLQDFVKNTLSPDQELDMEQLSEMDREELKDHIIEETTAAYDRREGELGPEIMRQVERVVLLRTVDSKWMQHIDDMDDLKQGIGLRAYGQRNPLVEYKFEGYEMFQNMIKSIREEVVRLVFRMKVQVTSRLEHRAAAVSLEASRAGGDQPQKKAPAKSQKIGRNKPCPCGSGKKYKRCCG